jgi:hypothetical protein
VRPPLDTGEIGDGISLALHDGVIGEIGSVRIYDPLEPCDVADMQGTSPIVPVAPAFFQKCNAIPFISAFEGLASTYLYPMTCYQREYKWPPVGPMPYDGERNVSLPPQEVPLGQTDWALQPVTCLSINRVSDEVMPELSGQPLDSESIIPQRGNRRRDTWTVRKTMAITPTVFLRTVLLEGDTRRWFVSGVTRDGSGNPLGSCDVVLMQSDKIMLNPDIMANPIVAQTVSDGSGNYSIQVRAKIPHQAIAYKVGGPDVAGITTETVIPTDEV